MKRLAIDVALTQLGVSELTGHNDGIPSKRYMKGDKLAWCAGFVLWCFKESTQPTIPHKQSMWWRLRAVKNLWTYLEHQGYTLGKRVLPRRGDIIFFKYSDGTEHVGIIETLYFGGTTTRIVTIEGNRKNSVSRGSYNFGDAKIAGYARVEAVS